VKVLVAFIALTNFLIPAAAFSQTQGQDNAVTSEAVVFRAPFLLKLEVDKGHYYEQQFDKVPYVADNNVYLFVKEKFGINVTIANDQIMGVSYQPNPKKSDVWFIFTQENSPSGPMMMLVTQNKLKHRLSFDALMTNPGQKGIFKTSIIPIDASLSNVESWPDPIVQLVLRNFRFSDRGTSLNQGASPPPTQK
jgi:hypothetical protein